MKPSELKRFKLPPNRKFPPPFRFFEKATADPDELCEMWTEPVSGDTSPHNAGVLTGDGIFVPDVDVKNGRNGRESLRKLVGQELIPLNTYCVRTPSGGLHVYLKAPPGVVVRNRVDWMPGIDIRGHHGYVAGVGSVVDGKAYVETTLQEWLDGRPALRVVGSASVTAEILDAPSGLLALLPRGTVDDVERASGQYGGVPLVEYDRPENVVKANAIVDHWEEVEEGRRNDSLFKLAKKLGDYGISPETGLDLCLRFNEEKLCPPLDVAEVQQACDSAYRGKRIVPLGARCAEAEFGIEEVRPRVPEKLPLTLAAWLVRPLPPPDFLMGEVLSTTTRALLVAPTGLGKTMFALALAFALASGTDFLHWKVRRAAKVLYIDGEMSRRLFKARLEDAVKRLGTAPEGLFALSREDLELMPPLNTKAGQRVVDDVIERIGDVDFIIFDNIMSLTLGDMKEEDSWRDTMPWVRALTKRCIGQMWIHHTGIDESRGYGTKTKEWELDLVMLMERTGSDERALSFRLAFSKARERTPGNWAGFEEMFVSLDAGHWHYVRASRTRQGNVSPLGRKFLGALEGLPEDGRTTSGWRSECERRGLLNVDNPRSARSLFDKYKRELIAANAIACDGDAVLKLFGFVDDISGTE